MNTTKMQTGTKTSLVHEHLKRFGTITPLEAIKHYGALRLAVIISELKHRHGMAIRTNMLTTISTITNKPVKYAQYELL